LDNTIINYDRAVSKWVDINQLEHIVSVEDLKRFYNKGKDNSNSWLVVQEWLYTEGLRFANLAEGTKVIFRTLREMGFSIVIISHKSIRSVKSSLDLHTPAINWLTANISEFDFNLEDELFLEQSRSEKILRIKRERLTHFVDDLLEVFLEPEFPKEVSSFWLTNITTEIAPSNVTQINSLSEILNHV